MGARGYPACMVNVPLAEMENNEIRSSFLKKVGGLDFCMKSDRFFLWLVCSQRDSNNSCAGLILAQAGQWLSQDSELPLPRTAQDPGCARAGTLTVLWDWYCFLRHTDSKVSQSSAVVLGFRKLVLTLLQQPHKRGAPPTLPACTPGLAFLGQDEDSLGELPEFLLSCAALITGCLLSTGLMISATRAGLVCFSEPQLFQLCFRADGHHLLPHPSRVKWQPVFLQWQA